MELYIVAKLKHPNLAVSRRRPFQSKARNKIAVRVGPHKRVKKMLLVTWNVEADTVR